MQGQPVTERGVAHLRANLSALAAAVFFGASVVAVRVAVRDIPPLSLGWLRFGQGCLALLVLLAVLAPQSLRVPARDMGYIALLGCVFFAAFPFTFNTGLQYTNASRGALLLASMPMWSAWLARRVVGERLSRQQATGVALTAIGIGGVLSERGLAVMDSRLGLVGDLLLLATALLGAVYGVLAPRACQARPTHGDRLRHDVRDAAADRGRDPRRSRRCTATAVGSRAPCGRRVPRDLGIPGGAIGFALWTIALSHLSPTQVAVYVNVNPLVATLLGAVLLHERLTSVFFAGFAAVATGVFMVNRRSAQ